MKTLHSRLTAAVMLPLIALAICFGFLTCWMIWKSSHASADRLLVGSVRLLAEAADHEPALRDQMLPFAVKILRRRPAPLAAYSLWQGDKLIAGDAKLRPPKAPALSSLSAPTAKAQAIAIDEDFLMPRRAGQGSAPFIASDSPSEPSEAALLRNDVYQGHAVRVASVLRQQAGTGATILVQVAEPLSDRKYYQYYYYLIVFSTAVLILLCAWLLFHWALAKGLAPFSFLTEQIDKAHSRQHWHVRLRLTKKAPYEARLLANSFNSLLSRTDKAIESLRQFTANASHQMRTPLAILRVHLDILEREGTHSAQGKAALEDIGKASLSLEHLLIQLIRLARAEEIGVDASDQFDLHQLAAHVIADRITQPAAEKSNISFDAPDDGPLFVYGSADFAAEMIANLFDNAIKYNSEFGNIRVRLSRMEESVRIAIEDDGPGFTKDEQQHIFERFYRGGSSQNISGSGLGLSIVRALADNIGASVQLSPAEKGFGLVAIIDFRAVMEE